MAGVIIKIKSMYPDLSNAEKKIADFIFKNYENVPFESVHRLSKKISVSVASISRFVKSVGYERFKDFKVELAKDTSIPLVSIYKELSLSDTDEEIVKKVFWGNIRSIEDTLKMLKITDIIHVAKMICKSKRTIFVGLGGSANVANEASMRFSHLFVQAESYTEPTHMIVQALRVKENELVFGISHSGRTKITIDVLKLARKNGAITIGMSNYLKSPLREVSNYFLCTSFPETKVKVAALSSRIAQLCLIDALYILIARYKKDIGDVEKLNIVTETLLRLEP